MNEIMDGPASPNFKPLPITGNLDINEPDSMRGLSEGMHQAFKHAPLGSCVAWGIPFEINKPLLVADQTVSVKVPPTRAGWLVFLHTSDERPLEKNRDGFLTSPVHGAGRLNEYAADYVIQYADGRQVKAEIHRRHQVGAYTRDWGENCFQAVEMHKPFSFRTADGQRDKDWGWSQTRVSGWDYGPWVNWLWAWENPSPQKEITGIRFVPHTGALVVSAVTAGDASELPLRWQARRKAVLTLPEGESFTPDLDKNGLLAQIRLDLGQVISARQRQVYPNERWSESYNNQPPQIAAHSILIEYTAHPDACFHLANGRTIPAAQAVSGQAGGELQPVPTANQRVRLLVVERGSSRRVAVKLHVHGSQGEYLAPVDRHRIINPGWFEDYSVDFDHLANHPSAYISGETVLDLPLGQVFVEISKGFEIRPVRTVLDIKPDTQEVVIEVEKVLPWREQGWVSADTHVHFLSPISAMLEGAGEGVNIVNLLASQWGELMTNVGDFDGKTTWGSREAGGDGEYLVRVGTENRQHVLGHISLLGYRGGIIAPMTTGGPDESALGDPVEILLTEWARQCKKQGGLVVLPHFPQPRAEHAVSIVSGDVDAVEMTSWEDLYNGISPYSLSDWYRYLNCGYRVAAVGGTDKMTAMTAVGTVRTYARIPTDRPFTYDAWMDAVRRAETFVTYGPLLTFAVDGQPMGSRIAMSASGGSVSVTWQVASVTVPMSRVELVVNGEIRESTAVSAEQSSGSWTFKVDRSTWLALLVRGHYPDKPDIIAAHSSPVMIDVAGSVMMAAADAVTILEQIEGALAYLDSVGTRAEDRAYRRMRLVIETTHRSLHNRLHQAGHFHEHTPAADHAEHH